jgi:bacterioferritin (cytochrome b1)
MVCWFVGIVLMWRLSMSNTVSEPEARRIYFEKKARYEELVHAKSVSDEILKMFGIPKYGEANPGFPGLEKATREMKEALDDWSRAGGLTV